MTNDPSLTLNERAILERFAKEPKKVLRERELGVRRVVLNSLVRRGYLRGLGGEDFLITTDGMRVVGGKQ